MGELTQRRSGAEWVGRALISVVSAQPAWIAQNQAWGRLSSLPTEVRGSQAWVAPQRGERLEQARASDSQGSDSVGAVRRLTWEVGAQAVRTLLSGRLQGYYRPTSAQPWAAVHRRSIGLPMTTPALDLDRSLERCCAPSLRADTLVFPYLPLAATHRQR
jgi:hypothetical protein